MWEVLENQKENASTLECGQDRTRGGPRTGGCVETKTYCGHIETWTGRGREREAYQQGHIET
jgi:hypothetical protein